MPSIDPLTPRSLTLVATAAPALFMDWTTLPTLPAEEEAAATFFCALPNNVAAPLAAEVMPDENSEAAAVRPGPMALS